MQIFARIAVYFLATLVFFPWEAARPRNEVKREWALNVASRERSSRLESSRHSHLLSRLGALIQLPTEAPGSGAPALSRLSPSAGVSAPAEEIPGRRQLPLTPISDLGLPGLIQRAVELPEANTMAHKNFAARRFGRVQDPQGEVKLFNPECILVQFAQQKRVSALRVESGHELEAVRVLLQREDVKLAELDMLQKQTYSPNDPLVSPQQWHHQLIGSMFAWDRSLGDASVRIAIVDPPFQMDHPDLVGNTVAGWDAVANVPITASSGYHHSTFAAGLAAGVVGNGLGIAGVANCRVLPVNVNGFTSEVCNAIYWAATNNVRVVNVSWTGADSDAINAAGAFLRTTGRGILAMAGVNGDGFLDYAAQPDIWCISMTDAADNPRSAYGYHIDFAAPGYNVYSTTINGGYVFDSGSSYATPIFCGAVALLFSINPALSPEQAVDILKSTATDKGPAGWDMWYGWGRINLGEAAAKASEALPRLSGAFNADGRYSLSAPLQASVKYTLEYASSPAGQDWQPVPNAPASTNDGRVVWTDLSPVQESRFYRVVISSF